MRRCEPGCPADCPADCKAAVRRAMLARRREQSAGVAAALSARAQRALMCSPCWQAARQVVLYVAVRGETATDLLLEAAWADGRTVLLPRCLPRQQGRMELVPCQGRARLRAGAYGIPEPAPDLAATAPEDLPTVPGLLVVPGLAFDRRGRRLGMGGGYYDRLLPQLPGAHWRSLGLCFHWQVLEALPHTQHDAPVGALCTERGVQDTQNL